METGSEQNHFSGEDGKLSFRFRLAWLALRSRPARIPNDTNVVADPEILVLIFEGHAACRLLCLAHDLDMALHLLKVVEDQFFRRLPLVAYPPYYSDLYVLLVLSLLHDTKLFVEVIDIMRDGKVLRVGIWRPGFSKSLDSQASHLKDLLSEVSRDLAERAFHIRSD